MIRVLLSLFLLILCQSTVPAMASEWTVKPVVLPIKLQSLTLEKLGLPAYQTLHILPQMPFKQPVLEGPQKGSGETKSLWPGPHTIQLLNR